MSERLLIVKNIKATGADRLDSEVFRPLDDAGVAYETFNTPSPDYEENVDAMRHTFRDGDRIVIPAGDGTVSQAVNAVIRNGLSNVDIAALPYGGFVDLSDKKARIMDVVDDSAETETRYPISISINGEHWRHAPDYMGLGDLALFAASFATPESREKLKGRSDLSRRIAQVAQLGSQYFEHRNTMLPRFLASTSPLIQQAVTDVMLVNNKRAGGIIRFPKDFGVGETFGVVEKDISHILPNIPFGLMALAGHAPSREQNEFHISFADDVTLPIHTEGEFERREDVSGISATKSTNISYQSVRVPHRSKH